MRITNAVQVTSARSMGRALPVTVRVRIRVREGR